MLHCTANSLTDQEIDELIKTIHLKESRDQIIMAFIGIASTIALRYARSSDLDADDLQSEAILGIVDAVNRFPNVNHNNIGGYINRYIHQYCLRFIKKNSRRGVDVTEYLFTMDKDSLIVEDLIDQIVKSDLDLLVVDLATQGFSDIEIANLLECSRQHIWKTRKTLAKRLKKCLAL